MSSQDESILELDAHATAQLLKRSRRRFVDAGTAALTAEIETYAIVPRELLFGDVADTVRRNIELFIKIVTTGEPASESDLVELRTSAAKRADEGLPLGVIMWAYHLIPRVITRQLAEVAGSDRVVMDTEIVSRIFDFLGVVTATASEGYLEEFQLIETGTRTAADRMLEALLTGTSRPALDDYPLAERYAVLALALAKHPDELQADIGAGMAARRKLRRVRSALRELAGQQPMASLTASGGIALVPLSTALTPWSDVAEKLTAAAQASVTAAVAVAAPDGVPAAARLAREVLEVVRLLRRPSGVYQLEDVSFEYQVTRPGQARRALAQTLDAVHDEFLLETLRAYLHSGGNRHRSARLVSVHPNTVDNRLRKLARLTGKDPTRPADAIHLQMALLARDAERRT